PRGVGGGLLCYQAPPQQEKRGMAGTSPAVTTCESGCAKPEIAAGQPAHFPSAGVVLTAHSEFRVMPRTLILSNFAVVVIGASAGGVEAMRKLVAKLDPKWPAAYFLAIHVGPNESRLAAILSAAGPLPVERARHGGSITPGRMFVAPPDHHLLLARRVRRPSRAPPPNSTRPP